MSRFPVLVNCDVGESWYDRMVGCDEKLIPLADAVNIACGGHAGDSDTILSAVCLAMEHHVLIGAHPSYPDRQNFGRTTMNMTPEALKETLVEQISLVKEITEKAGGTLHHVKAHGALYNRAAIDSDEATTLIDAVVSVNAGLTVIAPATSEMTRIAKAAGVNVLSEAFVDRRYDGLGRLVSRERHDALISTPETALGQLKNILAGFVVTDHGHKIPMTAETVCIHGDHPAAYSIMKAVNQYLRDEN